MDEMERAVTRDPFDYPHGLECCGPHFRPDALGSVTLWNADDLPPPYERPKVERALDKRFSADWRRGLAAHYRQLGRWSHARKLEEEAAALEAAHDALLVEAERDLEAEVAALLPTAPEAKFPEIV